MLKKINKLLVKVMPILTPAGLLIGVLFGDKIIRESMKKKSNYFKALLGR